jgi:RNA polymerase sigma factor for flagellar operon FliA
MAELSWEGVEDWLPLVRYVANRRFRVTRAWFDHDDLVSAGLIGVRKALNNFDPTKSASLKTHVSNTAFRAMQDALRVVDWVPRHVRINGEEPKVVISTNVSVFDDGKGELQDLLADARALDPQYQAECTEAVDALKQLTPQQRQVIELSVIEGLTLTEVGKIMGFTESRACQIRTVALGLLRSSLSPQAAA